MAENGHENGQDPTLVALHDVVAELRGLRADTNSRLESMDARLGSMDARLGSMDARFESVEQVLRGHTRQFEEVVGRLVSMDGRLGRVEHSLDDLRGEVHEGFAELGQKMDSATERDRRLEQSVQQLGERVAKLEARSPEPR